MFKTCSPRFLHKGQQNSEFHQHHVLVLQGYLRSVAVFCTSMLSGLFCGPFVWVPNIQTTATAYHCNSWACWLDLPFCSVSIYSNVFQCQIYVLKLFKKMFHLPERFVLAFMESCWRHAKLVVTVCKDPLKEAARKKKSKQLEGWAGDVGDVWQIWQRKTEADWCFFQK